jgi:hypothetical protein
MNLIEALLFMVLSAGLLALGHFLSGRWGTVGWLIGVVPVGMFWTWVLIGTMTGIIKNFKSSTAVGQKAKEDIEKVLALPFEQVKQRAVELISDTLRFRSITDHLSNNPLIERLGPVLQDFFAHFESVEEVNGEFFVSRQAVTDSTLRPGFLKIGSDFEHSELVVRPGEDRVFIVTDSEHVLDGLPTIYHNICLLE